MDGSFLGVPIPVFNSLGIVTLWGLVAFMVITRKLIWHKDYERALSRAEARADRWEGVALQLLGVSEKLAVGAESLLTKLPDPGADPEAGDRS